MPNVDEYVNENGCLITVPYSHPTNGKCYPYINDDGLFDISLNGASKGSSNPEGYKFDFDFLIDLVLNQTEKYPKARIRCKPDQPLTKSPSRVSISKIDWRPLTTLLIKKLPTTIGLENNISSNNHILSSSYDFDLSRNDERKMILANHSIREGQSEFRKKLIKAQGGTICSISGCGLEDVIQAAHIMPYLGEKDNHVENGLLLRADLHLLFDKMRLGINPDSLEISLSKEAAQDSTYSKFQGVKLKAGYPLSYEALFERWKWFQNS
jgi:hypothetical protein